MDRNDWLVKELLYIRERVDSIAEDVAALKARAAVFGALAGAGASLVTGIIILLAEKVL